MSAFQLYSGPTTKLSQLELHYHQRNKVEPFPEEEFYALCKCLDADGIQADAKVEARMLYLLHPRRPVSV